ncbi:hypothetical protein GCM10009717_02670 [Agromyces allii]|uniref:Uncharacterized protein n=1 Tax=Agromyces allii TaxID=393607 RepID=A0ABN2Q0Z9_9MICO
MREEGELREDQAEGSGHEQLEPRVTEQDEPGDHTAEGQKERADERRVEPAGAGQQTGFANDPGEGGEAAGDVKGAGARLGGPDRTEGIGVRDDGGPSWSSTSQPWVTGDHPLKMGRTLWPEHVNGLGIRPRHIPDAESIG